MDTQALKAFLRVSELGSFSLAAEQLHLTQSAISKRIASLELRLDTQLFDRLGKHCTLTEAGRTLLPHAKSIISNIDDSKLAIQNLKGSVAGQLSLATSHHIGLHRLPAVLKTYLSQFTDVDLQLSFMASEQICDGVEQGEIELGVVTLPLQQRHNLNCINVWHDPLCIVVSNDIPHDNINSVEDLSQYGAILPQRGTFTRELIEEQFAGRPLSVKEALSTNYLETIKMLVSVGLGWSVLPQSMLSQEITELRIPTIKLSRQLGIVHHKNRTLSNAAKQMIAMIEQQADKNKPHRS